MSAITNCTLQPFKHQECTENMPSKIYVCIFNLLFQTTLLFLFKCIFVIMIVVIFLILSNWRAYRDSTCPDCNAYHVHMFPLPALPSYSTVKCDYSGASSILLNHIGQKRLRKMTLCITTCYCFIVRVSLILCPRFKRNASFAKT